MFRGRKRQEKEGCRAEEKGAASIFVEEMKGLLGNTL
jgi:hypothetical protein